VSAKFLSTVPGSIDGHCKLAAPAFVKTPHNQHKQLAQQAAPDRPFGRPLLWALRSLVMQSRGFSLLVSLVLWLLALPAAGEDVIAVADVEIASDGSVANVVIVRPILAPEMAQPIETTISQWTLQPGVVDGKLVRRTTSVTMRIYLADIPDVGQRIIAEKLSEGPRVLEPGQPACMSQFNSLGKSDLVRIGFTVASDGSTNQVVAISSTLDESLTSCAVKAISQSKYLPESVDGQPVTTETSTTMVFGQ